MYEPLPVGVLILVLYILYKECSCVLRRFIFDVMFNMGRTKGIRLSCQVDLAWRKGDDEVESRFG